MEQNQQPHDRNTWVQLPQTMGGFLLDWEYLERHGISNNERARFVGAMFAFSAFRNKEAGNTIDHPKITTDPEADPAEQNEEKHAAFLRTLTAFQTANPAAFETYQKLRALYQEYLKKHKS